MIRRYITEEIFSHLREKEITLITGPRQVGKTTLMQVMKSKLEKERKAVLWFNLDVEKDWKYFSSQQSLLQKIRLEVPSGFVYVFVDEIQRKSNAGLFLKGLYDSADNIKFIVSGSGSLELKEKIKESLAGRKRIFELLPVSFYEYADYKTEYKYSDRLEVFFETEQETTLQLLYEYLNYGGFPRIVTEDSIRKKIVCLDEIYQSYIDKDIKILLNIDRVDIYAYLVKYLSAGIGTTLNYSDLASKLSVSAPTIKNYIWYGERTFLFKILTPFFRNKHKELSKAGILYFNDLGLRNFIIDQCGKDIPPHDLSFLFQNLVFQQLREKLTVSARSLHFWRTTSQAEVDFIFSDGINVIPVEVKFKKLTRPEIGKSLFNFCSKYNVQKAFIINQTHNQTYSYNECQFHLIPFWKIKYAEM